MKVSKYLLGAVAVLGLGALTAAPAATAQVSIGVNIGAAPVCPYGYYDFAPYNCAPYGYYGPEWFNGGVFIGAGPWFHGPKNFHGTVNNAYDPRHGYHGALPARGAKPEPGRTGPPKNFHGNETHDNAGHVVGHGR